jgi:hypothetical protein
MLYLLDANTLIDANRDYYPVQRVPEFWNWVYDLAERNVVGVPVEIYEEFAKSKRNDSTQDDLAVWASRPEIKQALAMEENISPALVQKAIEEGYATDLSEDELEAVGRDPFLIAYGLVDPSNRVVVTTEVSKPSKTRANRKLPDVCRHFGIRCINTFELLRELDFRTDWKR